MTSTVSPDGELEAKEESVQAAHFSCTHTRPDASHRSDNCWFPLNPTLLMPLGGLGLERQEYTLF